uniref:DALR anticodon binding domain-containing protein n=2 Tax=Clastoptera arizonana TaxID=38151 RepID=A0A1B6DXP0_9HEMI
MAITLILKTRLRIKDMTELSEYKEQLPEVIKNLSNAALHFDLLSTKVENPVTLNIKNTPMISRERSTKGSTFVLYNYARICAILQQFQDKVAMEYYDPLPSVLETSFSPLIQEEEWNLMFDYILEWPNVLNKCQHLSSLRFHYICGFLSSLSLCFSRFYRKYRILTEPLPQLLPLMTARLHLLLGLRQVYQNAFNLLSIHPPTHM